MPRYNSDISELLYEEDVNKMFARAKSPKEAYLVAIFWITGARPSEVVELQKKDFALGEHTLRITISTKKLGKTNEFILRHRTLEFERPEGYNSNPYIETIIRHMKVAPEVGYVLPYTTRWAEKTINRLGMETIGKLISPYHFRHSVLSHHASKGMNTIDLMAFKGAKSINSVAPYLHAKPFVVKSKDLERGRI
jgi:integrase